MKMPHDRLQLNGQIVAELFPFHILVDASDGYIYSVGEGLNDIAGLEKIGQPFNAVFHIERPIVEALSSDVLKQCEGASFILQLIGTQAKLRGQFVFNKEGDMIFLGTLLVEASDSLEKLGVSMSKFTSIDLTPDLVILQRFREIEKQDLKRRAQQLAELSKSRDEMNKRANTDELTGVANRRGFWEVGSKMLAGFEKNENTSLILILLDLDGFKNINDQYGHEAGDAILLEIATRISDEIGERGLVGRLGGDEFVVIRRLDVFHHAEQEATNLLKVIKEPIRQKYRKHKVDVSMGVVKVSRGDSLDDAINKADLAMYEGRRKQRGAIFWYTDSIEQRVENKRELTRKFTEALNTGLIAPHYQPIVTLKDTALVSFEALARWTDPELGSIRPDIFIEVANEAGLLQVLDKTILDLSLDQLTRWHKVGKKYTMHVNLSADSLDSSLCDQVLNALEVRRLDPKYLILELTETTLLENTQTACEILSQLSESGVKVQLDDFGTGYSSLTHIRDLPVHGIKIDKSFVADARANEKSRELLKSVVDLASNLQLEVVAEGIETGAQFQFLEKLGCDYGQGFYIGKPTVPDTCEIILNSLNKAA